MRNQTHAKRVLNIGQPVIGMVVDGVSDVIKLSPEQVEPAPETGTALNTDYLIGLGIVDDRMLILDIDKLMSGSEIDIIEELAA